MPRLVRILPGCLLAVSALGVVPPAAATDPAAEPVQRLIIQYRADTAATGRVQAARAVHDDPLSAAARVAHSAGLGRVAGLRYLKSVSPTVHVARLDDALSARDAQALLERLRADPAVLAVTVDQRLRRHAVPTDPFFTNPTHTRFQWHLQAPSSANGGINAVPVWAQGITGAGVTVAVLDGGYRPHADLLGNLLTGNGYDFISDLWTANDGNLRDADASDPGDGVVVSDPGRPANCEAESSSWHGTHIAGLIAAQANGIEGVGLAYGARVLPVRVLGRCGGYLSDIQAGMRWAAGLATVAGVALPSPAVKVLNLSLGVDGGCDAVTQSVIDEIRAAGMSVVASAGNEAADTITKPANCMGVVGVTAHTRDGRLATYANVGAGVSVSAPGGDRFDPVISTLNTGTQEPLLDTWGGAIGTSMATPLASGVLALMASAQSSLAMPTLEALMREAVRPFPAGSYCALRPGVCGLGLLDAGLAVAAAQAAPAGQADLEVLQRVSARSWDLGSTVQLQIHVRNWGAVAATAVQLTATLSGLEPLSLSSDNPAVVFTPSGSGLSAVMGDLPPGGSLVITVNAQVNGSADSVSSTAEVSGAGPEPTLVNNTHRLEPSGVITDLGTTPVTPSESGGGCTAAPPGQADMGLPLLALVAALALLWRRRSPRS